MSIYGIAYKGGLELSENGQLGFRISSAIFQSNGNTGMGSLTGKWFFEIAPSNGFVLERFGASETKGLFGGVKNEKQRLYSEATERVIGDIVTSQICRICGHAASVQNGSVILVLGPAFPKLVGRIASLRIQRSISVIFICPKPFPKWILAGVNETIILPQYGSKKVAPIDGWEDEAMVHGYETSLKGTQLVVQEITYWEKGKRFEIKDNNLAIISLLCDYLSARETNEKIHLPRELFAAGEHVNYYADQPIPGLEGEAFDNEGRFYETTPRKNAPPTFPKDFFPVQWKQ